MFASGAVDIIYHGSSCSGFTASGCSGNDDHSAFSRSYCLHDFRGKIQFLKITIAAVIYGTGNKTRSCYGIKKVYSESFAVNGIGGISTAGIRINCFSIVSDTLYPEIINGFLIDCRNIFR
jgi:hypothetical protein